MAAHVRLKEGYSFFSHGKAHLQGWHKLDSRVIIFKDLEKKTRSNIQAHFSVLLHIKTLYIKVQKISVETYVGHSIMF